MLGGAWMLALAACMSPPTPAPATLPPPQPSPTLAATGDIATALQTLILDERAAAIAGDAATLAALWAANAVIVDGRATADPADDYTWRGQAAILDRYHLAVFPAPPPPLAPTDLAGAIIEIAGTEATVRLGGDHWRMALIDGRWQLLELRYN